MHQKTGSVLQSSSQTIIGALLVLGILFGGCSKEDAVRPSIEVFTPSDNQGFSACDEVTITGRATDNKGLNEVTVTLTDQDGFQVLGSSLVAISGTESQFSLKLKLGGRYTETGIYQLLLTVYDQAGNSANETVPIALSEVPQVLLRPLWAGADLVGGTTLFYRDSLSNIVTGPFLGTGLSDFETDNRNQLLLTSELLGGRFTGRRMDEFDVEFQTDLPTGAMQDGISGISVSTDEIFLSLKVPPYMRVFDLSGELTESWSEVLYPASALLVGEDNLYVSVKGFGGNPIKTDVYGADSRQLKATNVLDWEVEHIRQLENGDVIVAGNESGLGRVRVLNSGNLTVKASLDLQEAVLGLDGSGSEWFLLLESGIWQFEESNASANLQLLSGSFESLAWEAIGGQLYIGGENNVFIIDGNGSLMTQHVGGYGEVKWIDFQYNK